MSLHSLLTEGFPLDRVSTFLLVLGGYTIFQYNLCFHTLNTVNTETILIHHGDFQSEHRYWKLEILHCIHYYCI